MAAVRNIINISECTQSELFGSLSRNYQFVLVFRTGSDLMRECIPGLLMASRDAISSDVFTRLANGELLANTRGLICAKGLLGPFDTRTAAFYSFRTNLSGNPNFPAQTCSDLTFIVDLTRRTKGSNFVITPWLIGNFIRMLPELTYISGVVLSSFADMPQPVSTQTYLKAYGELCALSKEAIGSLLAPPRQSTIRVDHGIRSINRSNAGNQLSANLLIQPGDSWGMQSGNRWDATSTATFISMDAVATVDGFASAYLISGPLTDIPPLRAQVHPFELVEPARLRAQDLVARTELRHINGFMDIGNGLTAGIYYVFGKTKTVFGHSSAGGLEASFANNEYRIPAVSTTWTPQPVSPQGRKLAIDLSLNQLPMPMRAELLGVCNAANPMAPVPFLTNNMTGVCVDAPDVALVETMHLDAYYKSQVLLPYRDIYGSFLSSGKVILFLPAHERYDRQITTVLQVPNLRIDEACCIMIYERGSGHSYYRFLLGEPQKLEPDTQAQPRDITRSIIPGLRSVMGATILAVRMRKLNLDEIRKGFGAIGRCGKTNPKPKQMQSFSDWPKLHEYFTVIYGSLRHLMTGCGHHSAIIAAFGELLGAINNLASQDPLANLVFREIANDWMELPTASPIRLAYRMSIDPNW